MKGIIPCLKFLLHFWGYNNSPKITVWHTLFVLLPTLLLDQLIGCGIKVYKGSNNYEFLEIWVFIAGHFTVCLRAPQCA